MYVLSIGCFKKWLIKSFILYKYTVFFDKKKGEFPPPFKKKITLESDVYTSIDLSANEQKVCFWSEDIFFKPIVVQ